MGIARRWGLLCAVDLNSMTLVLSLIVGVVGWFVLMWLTANLLGLFVRGLFSNPELDQLEQEASEKQDPASRFITSEITADRRANKLINIIALALLVGFFYLLFHFLNMTAVIAAIMLTTGRLPDLLWEIKHGRKLNVRELPKNWVYWTTSFLDWASVPVFLYALMQAGYISF